MKIFNNHFGKFSSVILLTIILIINSKVLNISQFELYLNISSLLFISIIVIYFVIQFYLKNTHRLLFKIGLLILLFNLQILCITKFLNSVELDNNSPDISILDKNAAVNMSWIIIIPILFLLFIFVGSIFDYIYLINRNKNNVL